MARMLWTADEHQPRTMHLDDVDLAGADEALSPAGNVLVTVAWLLSAVALGVFWWVLR
jgi:hypothetical protein